MPTLLIRRTGQWYRQRWPRFLMLGPAIVLVAGAYTTWLAYSSDDGLVAQDYYKRGLLINRSLRRDHNAAVIGISAQGVWGVDGRSLCVRVLGQPRTAAEPVLRLISVPSGAEQAVQMRVVGGGWYAADLQRPSDTRWRAVLETDAWRLIMLDSVPGEALRFVANCR